MSIQSEIDRLTAAKASIAASLQAMGAEPPAGSTLDQYAAQLAAIAAAAPWLPLAGGTMTGNIQMGGSRITGVGEPQADTDAARKGDLPAISTASATLYSGSWTLSGGKYAQTVQISGVTASARLILPDPDTPGPAGRRRGTPGMGRWAGKDRAVARERHGDVLQLDSADD